MYAYIYIYIYIYVYRYTYIYIYIYAYLPQSNNTTRRLSASVHPRSKSVDLRGFASGEVRSLRCSYICVYIYIYKYVCIYIYKYIYIYVHIYMSNVSDSETLFLGE